MLTICRESLATENGYSLEFISHTKDYHARYTYFPGVGQGGVKESQNKPKPPENKNKKE